MPHIAVSMYPGRDAETKRKLAVKLQDAIAEELKIKKEVVTVSIEDVEPEQWQNHLNAIPEDTFFVR